MAIGDKKAVVMESDRGVAAGVATLGSDGKLSDEQIPSIDKIGSVNGLGRICANLKDYDWNNGVSNGFYAGKVNSPDGGWWFGEVIRLSDASGSVVQKVRRQCTNINNTADMVNAERQGMVLADGVTVTWEQWEYENPPLVLDIEYRTTKRVNGKPVYEKNIDEVIHYRLMDETDWKSYANAFGAAPAGFGLGGNSQVDFPKLINPDNPPGTGWYYLSASVVGGDESKLPASGFWGLVENRYSEQTAYWDGNNYGRKLHRHRNGNTWAPWEYINPPMLLGVEYRTTERFLGKPVYTKLVDFGALPNTATKQTYPVEGGIGHCIYSALMVDYANFDVPFTTACELIVTNPDISEFIIFDSFIYIKTTKDLSNRNAYVLMKYTKITD